MGEAKGQAVFEFIVAAVLFFAIVFYIINFLSGSVNNYSTSSQFNSIEVKAMEISEYLVRVNLTKNWPYLSYDKIGVLDENCNDDYGSLLERFDVGEKKLKLLLKDGANTLLDCERNEDIPNIQRAEVERFALSENNTILNLQVIVW